ncbi:MAG: hypothetical protein EOP77_02190 [Variovorax sp.]|nr:MAG: hypothetical protein EOP77_02190 [Variovorax sp.]
MLPHTARGILVRSLLLFAMVLMVAASFESWGVAASAACVSIAHYLWAWEHVALVGASSAPTA